MGYDALFWIQIGCAVGGIICAVAGLYINKRFYEGFELLKKAQSAQGPEKEKLILRSLERTRKQLEAKDLTNEGRAKLQNILGLTYRFLAEIRDETANMDLAVRAYRECVQLTDREKLRSAYVDRRTTLGNTFLEMAKNGVEEKNLQLALVEFKEALAAADTKETADKRPELVTDIAGCHQKLALLRKDKYHAGEAIAHLKSNLAFAESQKNPVALHMAHLMLANGYACAADIEDPPGNLRLAIGHCDRALAIRDQMDRQFGELTNASIAAPGNVELRKKIDELFLHRAVSEYKLLSLFSLVHMKLADLEDRQSHLDSAMWAVKEASGLRKLQEEPDFQKTIQKWKGDIERMMAGESFEQMSGKGKAQPVIGFADGDPVSPA